jgi:hypothetical protein
MAATTKSCPWEAAFDDGRNPLDGVTFGPLLAP